MPKTHFKDPIAIKKQEPKDTPSDGKKSPWDFRCPSYDERSSCFVNAGEHYGVGRNQPVGTEKHSKVSPIPFGHHPTLEVDEVG